jgi:hypothetical protein
METVRERGRTVQNILLRRQNHPTAIGNREVKLEGNIVNLFLLGIDESDLEEAGASLRAAGHHPCGHHEQDGGDGTHGYRGAVEHPALFASEADGSGGAYCRFGRSGYFVLYSPRACDWAAAVAMPLDPEFAWYGALGAPTVRVRSLRPSDLDIFQN